jgi:hypothetical protein
MPKQSNITLTYAVNTVKLLKDANGNLIKRPQLDDQGLPKIDPNTNQPYMDAIPETDDSGDKIFTTNVTCYFANTCTAEDIPKSISADKMKAIQASQPKMKILEGVTYTRSADPKLINREDGEVFKVTFRGVRPFAPITF